MILKVYKGNGPIKWERHDENELLGIIYKYLTYHELVEVEDLQTFVRYTSIDTEQFEQFVTLRIISRYRSANSTIIYDSGISSDGTDGYDEGQTSILVQSSMAALLLQFLEHSNDCAIVPCRFQVSKVMEKLVRGVYEFTREIPSGETTDEAAKKAANIIGNVELVYLVDNKNLSTISINVPEQDLWRMIKDFSNRLQSFIKKTSTLNINNLRLAEFLGNGVSVVNDSTVKVGDLSKEYEQVVFKVIKECTM